MLWHGTNKVSPIVIYESGFDPSFAKDGGTWGKACYFAKNASYSDSDYKYILPNGERQLILAEVLLGKYLNHQKQSTLTKPPLIPGSNIHYDSVKGEDNKSDIYMVYEKDLAYARFVVTYTA